MPGLLSVQKCAKKVKTFLVSHGQVLRNSTVTWPYHEEERYKSSRILTTESHNAGTTSSLYKRLPVYTSLALNKFASDNLYLYVDVMADIHFYHDKIPLQTSLDGSKRLATLIEGQGLFALCFDLCFPHMYIGWRDILLKDELCERLCALPSVTSANIPFSQNEMAVLINCYKCRTHLEISKLAEAIRFCELAQNNATSLTESWITGVFYYTKGLVELQKFKVSMNCEESLDRVSEMFRKSCKGFKKDARLNFCNKYFAQAAEILVLYVESDKLVHSTDTPDITRYHKQACSLQQMFRDKMHDVETLIKDSESHFLYGSLYWHKTLEGMKDLIEKYIMLLHMRPISKGKWKDLRQQAKAYISVLIKHPNHEQTERPSSALFPVLQTYFQEEENTSRAFVPTEEFTERENTAGSMSDIDDLSSENPDATGSNSE